MLVLIGSSYRSAPLALRERLAFPAEAVPAELARLRDGCKVAEAMILSTCNRVELLARIDVPRQAGLECLKGFLCAARHVSREEIERYVYHHVGRDAVRHLFRVAAGLDSMILGEPQILGQVKQSYRTSKDCGATGPVLEHLLQKCLASAKRVRTVTGISRNAVSVAFAAVGLAQQIFGELVGRRALLIGAGKMSELVTRHLSSRGIADIRVTSRTYNHAAALAARVGGQALNWEDGLQGLGEVDIVVSCTGAPRTILGPSAVAQSLRARRGQPLFIIDIAVPRDVDPEVNRLDNVYLYDIDALQAVVDSNLQGRRDAADRAEREIECDVEAFERWQQSLEITPTIVSLRERMIGLGRHELQRHRNRLGPLSPEQERAVRGLLQSLIQKILHRPIVHLRKSVERGDIDRSTSTYRQIFGLDEPGGDRGPGGRSSSGDSSPEERGGTGPQRVLEGGKEG